MAFDHQAVRKTSQMSNLNERRVRQVQQACDKETQRLPCRLSQPQGDRLLARVVAGKPQEMPQKISN
jgi:hypothetical protein